jgi:uncharacterized metal-binding protein YceD (DUF177 family)
LRGNGQLRTLQLLEDEVILLVPAVPRHDANECESPSPANEMASADGKRSEPACQHPFAALAELKRPRQ